MKTLIRTLAAASVVLAGASQAQTYPAKSITLIVPFAVGGITDIVGRGLADELSKELQVPVVVENRTGAGGAIGAQVVSQAAPDGYTIGLATVSTHVVNPSCNKAIGYDPVESFTPVALFAQVPNILVARADFPADNLAELKKLAGQKSSDYTFGNTGYCGFGHLLGEQLNNALGLEIRQVPYRGGSQAVTDLLGGQVDLMFDAISGHLGNLKAGKLKALGIAAEAEQPLLPGVKPFAEQGAPAVNNPSWYGLIAPAHTPEPVVRRLEEAVGKAVEKEAFRNTFYDMGIILTAAGSDALKERIGTELEGTRRFIKENNIEMQ
ncbi:tripartite tricarboxylate transporter substrate binding protein [Alcaligenaceae bacterium]|nr:tripartite tricarboxylate transporter substrate binding protein [Alcaligenaceae bacterium]